MTEVTSTAASDGHRAPKAPKISFEVFPPKTEEMERNLWETINRLAPLSPNFVALTYSACASTPVRAHSTITRLLEDTRLPPSAHLTSVHSSPRGITLSVHRHHH